MTAAKSVFALVVAKDDVLIAGAAADLSGLTLGMTSSVAETLAGRNPRGYLRM